MLLLLLACAGGPPSPAPERLALDPSVSLGDALRACATLAADDAAGRCAVDALELRHAVTSERCAAVRGGLWQEECYFLAAEAEGGSLERRYAACAKAGRFAEDCRLHLWQRDLEPLRATMATDPDTWARAGAVRDRHAPLARPLDPGFEDQLWLWFWREFWRARGSTDPGHCDALSTPEAAAACREWAARAQAQMLAGPSRP